MRFLLILSIAASLCAASYDDLIDAAGSDPAQVVPALIAGSQALGGLEGAAAVRLADRLEPLARRVFRSNEAIPGAASLGVREHLVASGESPRAIMKRYAISDSALKLLNPSYDDRRLGAGARLKVVDFSTLRLALVVARSSYRSVLLAKPSGADAPAGPVVIAAWKVGVGAADSPTPLGASTIKLKARNPEWTHPDTGEVIAPDDPRNILGGYWVAVDPGADGTFKGIGFHGYTGAPSDHWLEQDGSHGCLRMLQDDIHALYALVPVGTRVVVRD
ncbi:MAG: L,D-transpeptidase family protein [Planctomycetota bacterium]|jgi:hypothetical protein|nr:L,D-transpeptidase family protein [Planctomycetota bacterium]